jgi:major vault protein
MAASSSSSSSSDKVIRLHPFHYVHVLDNNSLVTSLHEGPQVLTLKEHEVLVDSPKPMIVLPPRHYCKVRNPVERNVVDGVETISVDKNGNFVLCHGQSEIRVHQAPFALYPGEQLEQGVTRQTVVRAQSALRVICVQDFWDELSSTHADGQARRGRARVAGDEWLFRGPGTYEPRVECREAGVVQAYVVKESEALRLRARREFTDASGKRRAQGEEWLREESGSYLPDVFEEVVEVVGAQVITDDTALHLRALRTFVDSGGATRRAGEEWLLTAAQKVSHIVGVCEELVGVRRVTVLSDMQYCVVVDPVDEATGVPRYGTRQLRRGEARFFLQPGESLEGDTVRDVIVLGDNESLVLMAEEAYDDGDDGVTRAPGERWTLAGPGEFVPPVTVRVVETRAQLALDQNEGVYVRNRTSGEVRAVLGPRTYMLADDEELWAKQLPPVVEDLLQRRGGMGARDPTRVVTFRAPHNSAVQVYDYRAQVARVVFGPDLVVLGPDEHFTVLSLSGGKPKRPHVIKDIALLLGPDFMTDYVIVETADHAKLELRLSYNYQFVADEAVRANQALAHRLFAVPDFVGDGCKAIASRVRAAVAAAPFDEFHRNSARIIRTAVFDADPETGRLADCFVFKANRLLITNIDVKAVEPVDQRTREMLQRSVQLAIEITTKSVQLEAQQRAKRDEQAAKGELGNLRIVDETKVERSKTALIRIKSECHTKEREGRAAAEATARAQAALIEAQAAVTSAELEARAASIRFTIEIEAQTARHDAEIEHARRIDDIELRKAQRLAEIEATKFEAIIAAIGPDTIADIARAGPEMQAKLLEGLGIQSMLISDSRNPINLFQTANSLVGGASSSSQ